MACLPAGDLWSGNIGAVDGQPAIFDPATYYGHSEAEFGMSWCAGFSGEVQKCDVVWGRFLFNSSCECRLSVRAGAFWNAYHEVLPRQKGFEKRSDLYELYHKLNHFNL